MNNIQRLIRRSHSLSLSRTSGCTLMCRWQKETTQQETSIRYFWGGFSVLLNIFSAVTHYVP